MRIDEKGRNFFGSIETLERIDQLIEAADAYVKDRTPVVLDTIAATVRAAATKAFGGRWRGVTDRVSPSRYIGLSPASGDLIRVHFGYNRKEEYEDFPGRPWVGIWAAPTLDFAAIAATTHDLFRKPVFDDVKGGFPIFEYLENWPDLNEDGYAELHPICSDNGKAISEIIAAQLVAIVQALESVPRSLKPKK